MKQAIAYGRSHATTLMEIPEPREGQGSVLLRTAASMIRPGTETAVDFGAKCAAQERT
jgi:hypothetical protein